LSRLLISFFLHIAVIYVRENLEIVDNLYEGSNETSDDVASSLKSLCVQGDSLTLDDTLECYEEELTPIFEENNKEISREAKDRIHLSNILEEYTCQDNELPSSNKGTLRPWLHNGTLRDVRILHERHDSQIHLIPNFITEDECKAIEEAAKRDLHRGTVANGNGGSRLSENRKAWQAGVRVPWERDDDGDFIASYARRMYDYANHASGYGMTVDGQEDIMSIQYFGQDGEHPKGSSYTPETPDRYMPHCDGSCEGLPHRKGARVATMVSYCTVPKRGGSTNFKNADVHVKPELGAAVFFSYMDPVTKKMDTGWTTHSGCPVVEGTKRIVVHWMRVGVSTEEPWDSLNTMDIPKRMLEDES
jgi:2OG-Fe(II) oxygenase superfamily